MTLTYIPTKRNYNASLTSMFRHWNQKNRHKKLLRTFSRHHGIRRISKIGKIDKSMHPSLFLHSGSPVCVCKVCRPHPYTTVLPETLNKSGTGPCGFASIAATFATVVGLPLATGGAGAGAMAGKVRLSGVGEPEPLFTYAREATLPTNKMVLESISISRSPRTELWAPTFGRSWAGYDWVSRLLNKIGNRGYSVLVVVPKLK